MSGQAQSHHVYRAYLINHQGHICNSHHLNCESDEQAIEEARRLGYGVELWDRARRIAICPAFSSAALPLSASSPPENQSYNGI
jgi:hypothetical protein